MLNLIKASNSIVSFKKVFSGNFKNVWIFEATNIKIVATRKLQLLHETFFKCQIIWTPIWLHLWLPLAFVIYLYMKSLFVYFLLQYNILKFQEGKNHTLFIFALSCLALYLVTEQIYAQDTLLRSQHFYVFHFPSLHPLPRNSYIEF